ncbi:tyrosine-type recombinase/integrase [Desulfofustis glycolicus]|uniref:Site-specific recombinase XerD n=1 Tax=Desulfofustis glycolicus DSM 9705 TaxID=1121409 RepID=A0A1M5SXE7_9BACT|nr:site-specific integrase [Desulfofustis glycolicus]MCB2215232.1 tyrosine-type recombinase/integrase [Desulfobulbaceae bacterium]SHH42803.1 protein of unknown function [Desulfofustis glycolicus DSM 9705]
MDRTFRFTDAAIKALTIPDGTAQVDFFDEIVPLPGQGGTLGIRVSRRAKAWFVLYRANGRRRRHTFKKRYPELSLKDARLEAAKHLRTVHDGGDPAGIAKTHKEAPTVADLWEAYQESLTNRAAPKAPSTVSEEQRRWEKIIRPALGHMKVEDVKPVHLSDLLDSVAKKAPVSANRLHSLLQILFQPALAKGWITIHPLQWIRKPGGCEPPRKRVLSDDEIRTLWPHFDDLRPNQRDILRLGLLTAQRPGEIQAMRWADLDFDKALWTIPTTKSGTIHLVPLSRQVMDILQGREQDSPWVFPSKHNRSRGKETTGHTTSLKETRKRVQEKSGVTGWTSHDLRRTARTIMSRLSIQPHIRELVLNHSQGKIQAVYDQHDYFSEKKQALQKLADEIDRILGRETTSAKIVSLRRAG